jgi:mannosylglycerate hydrolase
MGRLQRLLDGLENTYNWQAPVVQFGNGSDHTHPQPTLPMLIKEANKRFEGQIELRHSTFVKFFDELKEWVSSKPEPLVEHIGELHQGWDRALLSGVFSARLYLKRMNDHIMRLLQDQIEPLAAASWSLGGRVRQKRLQLAWREVLRNHPHDDICGCSVDSTHLDMEIRFRHAQEISAMLLDDLHAELRQQFDLSHDDDTTLLQGLGLVLSISMEYYLMQPHGMIQWVVKLRLPNLLKGFQPKQK